ncbi:MAG: 2,3-bisphosphoglycerate-dependent phosphoglycerate mutase [Chloroflexota bacterium]|jgi:broad specificity phosphatase PhoE|nr:2,3-bisphosphoglycerate-dependent phosphoglycerate mutase [Chloroflexota bacterium]
MPGPPASDVRSRFLDALDRLHERFLVGVEGVTEVWLVRHGDAYAELVSLDDANIDPPLSPKGREEAARLGARLEASGVTAIWSSQILRARETAEIAAIPAGLTHRVDDRLREVKTQWEDATDEPADVPGYIPFVEPLDEVVARMDSVVREIAAAAGPGARVAAVSHAGAISMYLASVLKLDSGPLRVLPQFTSVSVLLLKDDRLVVQSIGDVGHLVREELPGG